MISRREFILFALAVGGTTYFSDSNFAYANSKNQELASSFSKDNIFDDVSVKIMPMGNYAQSVLFSINPNLLDLSTLQLIDEERASLVSSDSFLQGSRGFSQDTVLLNAAAEGKMPTLDIGTDSKSSLGSLDSIEFSTKQPAMFFSGSFEELPNTYRELGDMLGEPRCHIMADYISDVINVITETQAQLAGLQKKRIYITSGSGSYAGILFERFRYLQENVFNYLNCECVNEQVNKISTPAGETPLIDFCDLQNHNIDAVVFQGATPENIINKEVPIGFLWKNTPWVTEGRAFCVPSTEFGWIGPPLVSQCLGVLWLGTSLYPDIYQEIDVLEYAKRFYGLFVHCDDISDTLASLIVNSRVKVQ